MLIKADALKKKVDPSKVGESNNSAPKDGQSSDTTNDTEKDKVELKPLTRDEEVQAHDNAFKTFMTRRNPSSQNSETQVSKTTTPNVEEANTKITDKSETTDVKEPSGWYKRGKTTIQVMAYDGESDEDAAKRVGGEHGFSLNELLKEKP